MNKNEKKEKKEKKSGVGQGGGREWKCHEKSPNSMFQCFSASASAQVVGFNIYLSLKACLIYKRKKFRDKRKCEEKSSDRKEETG